MGEHQISHEILYEFIVQLYSKVGMPFEDAKIHAHGLVTASLRGVDSHGVLRTSAYLDRIKNGAINLFPKFCCVKEDRAMCILDADEASGYKAGFVGMSEAIETAKKFGVGIVFVRNSNHFGAASLYSQMAVDAGMVGFSTTNVKPGVTSPGAVGNVVGNNPFAIGIPTYNEFPFMLDMSLSVVAGGKLKLAISKNEKIPFDWATDKDGNPTDDPQAGFDGYFLPMGGFKGIGIAHAIDILCGVMTGGAFQNHIKNMFKDPFDSSKTCHMFMAVDASCLFDKEETKRRMLEYREYVQSILTISGKPLVLPGELEAISETERKKYGIPMTEVLYQEFENLIKIYELNVQLTEM